MNGARRSTSPSLLAESEIHPPFTSRFSLRRMSLSRTTSPTTGGRPLRRTPTRTSSKSAPYTIGSPKNARVINVDKVCRNAIRSFRRIKTRFIFRRTGPHSLLNHGPLSILNHKNFIRQSIQSLHHHSYHPFPRTFRVLSTTSHSYFKQKGLWRWHELHSKLWRWRNGSSSAGCERKN